MRWDDLFADLDARAEHAHRLDLDEEVADRAEAEVAGVGWPLRASGAPGPVSLQLRDGWRVEGPVRGHGPGWVLVAAPAAQVIVVTGAVVAVRGLGRHSGPPLRPVQARRTLLLALRGLARGGGEVVVRSDAGVLRGTLVRVGADHVDVAEAGPAGRTTTVPSSAVLAVVGDAEEG